MSARTGGAFFCAGAFSIGIASASTLRSLTARVAPTGAAAARTTGGSATGTALAFSGTILTPFSGPGPVGLGHGDLRNGAFQKGIAHTISQQARYQFLGIVGFQELLRELHILGRGVFANTAFDAASRHESARIADGITVWQRQWLMHQSGTFFQRTKAGGLGRFR